MIETLDDVIEWLADQAGVYGACPNPREDCDTVHLSKRVGA